MARTPRLVRALTTPFIRYRARPCPVNSGRIRAVVSNTASGETGEVGNADAPGTAVGGANSANPTGRSSTVTIWPADPQVNITPDSQTSFSNSVSPSRTADRTPSASSSQATQPRQRSGSRPIVVIDNGTSARVTLLPAACADQPVHWRRPVGAAPGRASPALPVTMAATDPTPGPGAPRCSPSAGHEPATTTRCLMTGNSLD